MACLRDGLVHAAPERPGKYFIEGYSRHKQQTADEAVNLAHAEIDQRPGRRLRPRSRACCVEFHSHGHQKGEGQHGKRDVPIPAVPGANLVSKPTSCFATSKHSSTGQRMPATRASVAGLVFAGPKTT